VAKEIQAGFSLSKSRYDYIITKIGIIPEIKQVSGTGYYHLFSTKNAMQIGIANAGMNLGLSPKSIKSMLNQLDDDESVWDPYNNDDPLILFYHNGDQVICMVLDSAQESKDWAYADLEERSDGFIRININSIKKKCLGGFPH